MSTEQETWLRAALMWLSNQRPVTEAGIMAALALDLWDGVDVPQDVREVIDSMVKLEFKTQHVFQPTQEVWDEVLRERAEFEALRAGDTDEEDTAADSL